MAESHKTLQAIICDILFPCADYATSDAQEKPRTDLLCPKKKQWEHDGSKSASKIEVTVRSCCEKQFEKKNFAGIAKVLRLSRKCSKANSVKLLKSYDLITCLYCLVLWKLRNLETRVKFRIEFIMVEKSNQKILAQREKTYV